VLGPETGPDEALAPLDRLDPAREAGRLTFVVRMGAEVVRDMLPAVIQKVTAQGHQPAWICDAMHARAPRSFDDVLDEVSAFFEVHRELATHPGGLHVELTGQPAAGGGDRGLQRHPSGPSSGGRGGLPPTPRLTRSGALDLAFLVADAYRASAPPDRARS
jgi:3-deoxy-7-phosphoheptulonate synthase